MTDGRIALVVAVSGHHDVSKSALSEITQDVTEFFASLLESYPHTPILVVSGLAEGADQLVAGIVRDLKVPGAERLSHMAVLPMPEDIYLATFEQEEARTAFRELSRNQPMITLPLQVGHDPEQLYVTGSKERRRQYQLLADALVKSSQILLALWDGHDSMHPGDTSEVVRRKLGAYRPTNEEAKLDCLNQNREPYRLAIKPLGTGPVRHIYAPREGHSIQTAELRSRLLLPENSHAIVFHSMGLLLNEFNRDILGHSKMAPEVARRCSSFAGPQKLSRTTPAMQWCANVRSWSTVLAGHYKTLTTRTRIAFLLSAFVAVLALHLSEQLPADPPLLLKMDVALYALAVFGAFIIYNIEHGGALYLWRHWVRDRGVPNGRRVRAAGLRYSRKHEDYRALAEALRVQFYWLSEGLSALACESYLNKHAGEMLWVRDATSEITLRTHLRDPVPAESAASEGLGGSLGKEWLEGQLAFFTRTAKKHERIHHRIKLFWWVLVLPTLFSPFLLLLLAHSVVQAASAESSESYRHWFVLAASTLMIVAVLYWNFAEIQGYEQEGQQYKQMEFFFEGAVRKLREFEEQRSSIERAEDSDDTQKLEKQRRLHEKDNDIRNFFWHVGKDALTENGDWLSMHRGRDLKIHHGGG